MADSQVTYEHIRDNFPYPNSWPSLNNSCYPHFHSCLELVYVRTGEMKAILNGKSLQILAPQLLIVPSYTIHLFHTEEYSDTIVLTVPLDYISSFQKILSKKTFECYTLERGEPANEIFHCMELFLEKSNDDPAITSYVLKGYIYVILGLLLEHIPVRDIARNTDHLQVRDILGYLHNHYLFPVSLETLANVFGYSKSRFSHIFNEQVGCSISEYINTLRCRNAATLLLETSLPMIDIAMNSGFESMRTFYRAFKRCYNITPSEYVRASKPESRVFTL